ncbi:SPBC16D10.01c [Scenedesmus sp. PABB004]|nr:SPBC16D10.01c [Scenedesmus sp. PABB004]
MERPPNRKKVKGATVKASSGGTGGCRAKAKGAARPALSAAQLFERAQAALAFERFDAALECFRDALELEPENAEIVDAHGALLAELGRTEEAVQALQRAVALSPEEGFEKYMYLGQLLEGAEALAATQKGVELLQLDAERAQAGGGGGSRALHKQLAAALCSLAEQKMGAADDVAEVSADAEALLQRARTADPESPEPLQALASLRYELGDAEAALALLRQSMALWFTPDPDSDEDEDDGDADGEDGGGDEELPDAADAAADADGELRIPKKPVTMSEEEEEAADDAGGGGEWETDEGDDGYDDDDDGVPSFEFRFECAKMLLELDSTTDAAVQVLEDLVAENDSVADVWHLLGLAYYSGGALEEAEEAASTGAALLAKAGVGEDDDMVAAFVDLQSAIAEAQAASGGEGGAAAPADWPRGIERDQRTLRAPCSSARPGASGMHRAGGSPYAASPRGHPLYGGTSALDAAALKHMEEDDEPQQGGLGAHGSLRPGLALPPRLARQSSQSAKASSVASGGKKGRRRWAEGSQADDSHPGGLADGGPDLIPAARGGPDLGGNTGHIVRMRRGEAWSKFLAYEGCCQVCMREGARGVAEASYFLGSGCEPLRAGLGITGLLLPAVLPGHMAAAVGVGSPAIDLGNEIHWDDYDADERKLSAAAFMNHMSIMRVRVSKVELPRTGSALSRLVCRNQDYSRVTVHLKLVPVELRAPVDVPFRLRKDGGVLPGSPMFDLHPEHHAHEAILEVVQGNEVLARGKISCKRLWQIGMEHSPEDDECDDGGSEAEVHTGAPKSLCGWLKGPEVTVGRGSTGLWVNVFDAGPHPGKVLLTIQRTQRELPGQGFPEAAAAREEGGASKGTLKVSSFQAYDYVLLAALKAQGCNERRLEVTGEWAWLLQAFASQYGVRSNYAVMTHLRWVLRPGVASVSQACFDLLARQLRSLLQQEAVGGCSLTQHEATMLGKIKADTEELLKLAFENYYLLSSGARKGILDGACSPPHMMASEFPPMALVAGVHLFEAMRDVFHPSDIEWVGDRFRIAAKGRWSRLATLCDDGAAQADTTSPLMMGGAPLRSHLSTPRGGGGGATPAGKANTLYSRIIRVASAIQHDLEYDRRLQEVPRLLPSSLNLPAITAAEYCVNYVHQLRSALAQCPPNQPTEMAIDMLVAVAQLQRYLEEHGLAVPRGQPGCIDSLELFAPHVRSWITNSQEMLCSTCRSLEATTELSSLASGATQEAPPLGGSEEGGVAPIAHEMLRHVVNEMHRYERVIAHWPLFGPYLEASLCVVLRAIIAAVSRQCGMTRVRGGGGAGPYGDALGVVGGGGGSGGSGKGSPFRGTMNHRYSTASAASEFRAARHPGGGGMAQWAWAPETPSPRKGGAAVRVLLMVREAVLLNSLKRLMVAAPIYESTINKWSGGASAPPGRPHSAADVCEYGGYDDVAPHVGAQFAQVVKELRTEYSSAVASTCQRMSAALGASPGTSIFTLLNQAKMASAQAGGGMTPMQQHAMIESLSAGMFGVLNEVLCNLAAALDGRVFVATGRGLWDFIGRDLLEFVENLQEGKDNKGAWRTRQNASLLLDQINHFFSQHRRARPGKQQQQRSPPGSSSSRGRGDRRQRSLTMGGVLSCCCGDRYAPRDNNDAFGRLSGPSARPETEEDRQARVLAAERAEARQRQFEQSPVGRAALKAVKDAKKPEPRPNAGGSNAQDWLS